MELVITAIGDKGDLKSERIGMKVLKDCELKFYLLFKTEKIDGGGFYNRSKESYWFYPKKVKAGDKVVVYSKRGIDKSEEKSDGTTVHFIYWGLTEPIFTNENKIVVLSQINDWSMSNKI
jgi:hypothetical protein